MRVTKPEVLAALHKMAADYDDAANRALTKDDVRLPPRLAAAATFRHRGRLLGELSKLVEAQPETWSVEVEL